eukprot:scaffold8126_cov170-Amphora_coffeaeformis.AAC.10
MASEKVLSRSIRLAVLCTALFARVLVGFQPHSGMNDFHGSAASGAYGGDFEAQRHWMELTVNVPIGEWYYYQLTYWGLDYPPLSAYQSWICGKFSQFLVGHESVALETSRGYENPTHKAFMRATVIVFELIFYTTAIWAWTRPDVSNRPHSKQSLINFLRVMLNPATILIDHGHFQYNNTALGLSLWAFFFCTWKPDSKTMKWPIIGSIFFCCSLSFKQMTLYYAPAVFAYLLGRCFQQGLPKKVIFRRFVLLGTTVILTFAVTWWPFVYFGPEHTTAVERLLHVLRRIFPFQRGLFEGKVANIWCSLSIQPFRIRKRIPVDLQPVAALALTLLMILPACVKLFHIGRRKPKENDTEATRLHRRYLLWGVLNTSLAFFLASFQVHEKSILMAVAPASLLAMETCGFSDWFALVATWTLWPLLVLDRLQVAYYCIIMLFVLFIVNVRELQTQTKDSPENSIDALFSQHWLLRWAPHMTVALTLGLHCAENWIAPPPRTPDIFVVLWSVVGCAMSLSAWVLALWQMYQL